MTIYLFNSIFDFKDASLVAWLTWGVLTLTLIVLCFYTFYTQKLQKNAEKQTKAAIDQTKEVINQTDELIAQRRLGVMPSLKHSIVAKYFTIKNIGNGPALNIKLKKFKLKNGTRIYFLRKEIDILLPGEDRSLTLYYEENDQEVSAFHLISLGLDTSDAQTVNIKFSFQDIEERFYEQENALGKVYKHGVVQLKK